MIRTLTFLLVALGCSLQLAAYCAHDEAARRRHDRRGAKTAIASLLLEDYDLTHVRIDLELHNTSTSLEGNALTTATVVNPSGLGKYAFELNAKLTLDSVKIDGVALQPVMSSPDVWVVTLPAALPQGASFQAQVWYRGKADTLLRSDLSVQEGSNIIKLPLQGLVPGIYFLKLDGHAAQRFQVIQ